mmetsp:Transcript_79294/g.220491  ORF Transcript_79294/g.220491 Transcript_79294/m.220491 type:complete len:246 (+) Transcript_79294:923-1660(+)
MVLQPVRSRARLDAMLLCSPDQTWTCAPLACFECSLLRTVRWFMKATLPSPAQSDLGSIATLPWARPFLAGMTTSLVILMSWLSLRLLGTRCAHSIPQLALRRLARRLGRCPRSFACLARLCDQRCSFFLSSRSCLHSGSYQPGGGRTPASRSQTTIYASSGQTGSSALLHRRQYHLLSWMALHFFSATRCTTFTAGAQATTYPCRCLSRTMSWHLCFATTLRCPPPRRPPIRTTPTLPSTIPRI